MYTSTTSVSTPWIYIYIYIHILHTTHTYSSDTGLPYDTILQICVTTSYYVLLVLCTQNFISYGIVNKKTLSIGELYSQNNREWKECSKGIINNNYITSTILNIIYRLRQTSFRKEKTDTNLQLV
jgi:hypothetical protein